MAEALAGASLTALLVLVSPAGTSTVGQVVPQPVCDAFRTPGGQWSSTCRGQWVPGFHVPGIVACDANPATHCWTTRP